jgi:hypothetical protein
MKANCLRQRHSRRTATHVTYWDPFPLAQWQRNSSRDSHLVAKPAPPTGALVLHPGARHGDDRREASMALRSSARNHRRGWFVSLAMVARMMRAARSPTATATATATTAAATEMSSLILKRACCLLTG